MLYASITTKQQKFRNPISEHNLFFRHLRYSRLFSLYVLKIVLRKKNTFAVKLYALTIFTIILKFCDEAITVKNVFHKTVYTNNWYHFKSSLNRSRKSVDSNTFLSAIERVKSTKEKE